MEESGDFTDEINVAVLDLETTGLSAAKDRIIQIAILMINPECRPFNLFESYFNPGANVDCSKSQHIHKITPDILGKAPSFEEKADEILELLMKFNIIVGHNVAFDFEFLRHEFNRIDQKACLGESDSDETWQAANKLKIAEQLSTKVKKFDNLQFKLLDTFRLALIALPNQKSYSLLALSNSLGIEANSFQTTGYKWGSTDGHWNTTLHVKEEVVKMREHNAITDVLQTEKLMEKCLKILNLSYNDILNGKCGKFEIDRQLLLAANKLMERKKPTSNELLELVELAPYQMNVNFPERSKCLRDMRAVDIKSVVEYLSCRQSHSDRRQRLICQAFLQFALDKEKSATVTTESNRQKQEESRECAEGKGSERNEKVTEGMLNVPQKDIGHNISEPPYAEMGKRKHLISTNECIVKISRYSTGEEAKSNEVDIPVTNSYEDETEDYEVDNLLSLSGNLFDSVSPPLIFTKDCPVYSVESECESVTDAGDSCSESILLKSSQKDKTQQSSQEYPMVRETKVTPEKDHKNEQKMKEMRIFSPAY